MGTITQDSMKLPRNWDVASCIEIRGWRVWMLDLSAGVDVGIDALEILGSMRV